MSSYPDKYHDSIRAALYDAWWQIQTPNAQERLNDWMLVIAASFRRGEPMSTDTAIEQAEAFLWAYINKDPKQFLSVLKG